MNNKDLGNMDQATSQPMSSVESFEINWFSKHRWFISIGVLIILIIAGLLYAYYRPRAIDPRSITNTDGGLGKGGRDIGYNWNSLPSEVMPGDTIKIKFDRDGKTYKTSCVFEKYFADDLYFCQASWPEEAFPVEGDLSKYTFTAMRRWDSLWNKFTTTLNKPIVLKIDPISPPNAQVGEPYSTTINFSYTGKSNLSAKFSGLPAGLTVDGFGGFTDYDFTIMTQQRVQNGKGQISLSGIPTKEGSHVGFLAITDTENNLKDTRQLQINVDTPKGSLKIIKPEPAPIGVTGEDYTVKFQASGGTPPYTWSFNDVWNQYKFCSAFIMKADGTLTSVGATTKPTVGSCSLYVSVKDATGDTQGMLFGIQVK